MRVKMEKVPIPFCLSFREEQQVPLELHKAELLLSALLLVLCCQSTVVT